MKVQSVLKVFYETHPILRILRLGLRTLWLSNMQIN